MKNLLFTGNPATGKTFLARAAAYYLCYEKLNIDSLQSKDIYKDWDKLRISFAVRDVSLFKFIRA